MTVPEFMDLCIIVLENLRLVLEKSLNLTWPCLCEPCPWIVVRYAFGGELGESVCIWLWL